MRHAPVSIQCDIKAIYTFSGSVCFQAMGSHKASYFLTLTLLLLSVIDGKAYCPSVCNCYDESDIDLRVDCRGRNINDIPDGIPANTTKLYLQETNITQVQAGKLRNLTDLQILDFKDSRVSLIQTGAFNGLTNLFELSLEGNRLQRISTGVFTGMGQLATLSLASNQINNIDSNAFLLSSLETLLLSNNKMSGLVTGIFMGLPVLRNLHLDNNEISALENSAVFSSLSQLQSLVLSNNEITRLTSNSFGSISSLQTLDVSNNAISSVECGVFTGVSGLNTLYLHANRLGNIPTSCVLGSLNQLENLYLSQNRFSRIAGDAFSFIQNVKILHLNGMPSLETVAVEAFRGLSSLESLALANNPNLTDFTPEHLPSGLHLRVSQLNLHGNGFQYIAREVYTSHSGLLTATIHGNPFHCNCSLRWIPEVMESNYVWVYAWLTASGSPRCETPQNLQRMLIKDMKPDDMTCTQPSITAVTPLRRTGYRGYNATFIATTGPGLPGTTWTNPVGQTLRPGDHVNHRIHVTMRLLSNRQVEAVYEIDNVTSSDAGTHIMRAKNAGGENSIDFMLLVEDPPIIPTEPAASAASISSAPWGIAFLYITVTLPLFIRKALP